MNETGVRITVDGKLALTTRLAAAEAGIDPASMRKEILRLGLEPIAHLDERTPLYAAVPLRNALRDRPGRGTHLRKAAPKKIRRD